MDFNEILNTIVSWATSTGIKIIIALIILAVTFRIINVVSRKILKKSEKKNLDKTLSKTLVYLGKIAAKCLVVICLIGYLGIDTSGLTALVASLGVCVGLAVNGALSNLAGGALILITRPFKIDDFVEIAGYSGVVEDIHIVTTKLRTGDNKVVYIPNGTASSGTIVNYSEKDTRRVDFTFSISYEDDFEKAKSILLGIMEAHEKVLKDPAPMARVTAHNASSVDIVARAWTNSADYWDVNFDLLEQVKTAFDKEGISIPYNQLDVHIKNQ